jgi:hypothetical protein
MQRKELFERLRVCLDPEQALHKYMSFDLAFGKRILKDANRLDLNVNVIKKENDIRKNVEVIASFLKGTSKARTLNTGIPKDK